MAREPIIVLLIALAVFSRIGFVGYNFFFPSAPSQLTVQSTAVVPYPTSDAIVLQVSETMTPFPTSVLIAESTIEVMSILPTSAPENTPELLLTMPATYIQDLRSTATQIWIDYPSGNTNLVSLPHVQVTPSDGVWVNGYYAASYCPTDFQPCEPCSGNTCIRMIPVGYNCRDYDCNYDR